MFPLGQEFVSVSPITSFGKFGQREMSLMDIGSLPDYSCILLHTATTKRNKSHIVQAGAVPGGTVFLEPFSAPQLLQLPTSFDPCPLLAVVAQPQGNSGVVDGYMEKTAEDPARFSACICGGRAPGPKERPRTAPGHPQHGEL
jgi:hypothetical protein